MTLRASAVHWGVMFMLSVDPRREGDFGGALQQRSNCESFPGRHVPPGYGKDHHTLGIKLISVVVVHIILARKNGHLHFAVEAGYFDPIKGVTEGDRADDLKVIGRWW